MSNFHQNISGCLSYKDYIEAAKWLSKAQESLILSDYSILVLELDKSWPNLFDRDDFKDFKINITNLDSEKIAIIRALKDGNYEYAKKGYSKHFSYKTFPEFGDLLNKYVKINNINAFNSSIKGDLTTSEKELRLDMDTHLEHPDKPFYRRVKSTLADFYITKASHYSLSIYEHKGRTVRHLPWNHTFARGALSAELGELISVNDDSNNLGRVSLIGDFKPEGNDLTDARYFTFTGRDHFPSALEALTGKSSSPSKKIDIDNFMKMKEVIPTASQMKAIHSQGNYIIDGPAGTGKSTTLLQKLLILTQQSNIQGKDILVLVKHDGLIKPFKQLLSEMLIVGVHIDSVTNFLSTQFGTDYEDIHLADIDRTECDVEELSDGLDIILGENSFDENIIDYLPSELINKRMVLADLKKFYQLKGSIETLEFKIKERESEIRGAIEESVENKFLDKKIEEYSLLNKFKHKQGLKLDPEDRNALIKLEEKYKGIEKIRLESPESEGSLYEPIIESIENEFTLKANTISGQNIAGKIVSLSSYVATKIEYEIEEIKTKSDKEKIDLVSEKFNGDGILKKLKTFHLSRCKSKKITKSKIDDLIWDKALAVDVSYGKRLIRLLANKSENSKEFQTVIIDEVQDVPNNNIELVSLYSKQLILSGDEAQKENLNGLGVWGNLRDKIGFRVDSELAIYRLRHNFRQTYELGNLSYNYRQLLLGQEIESLEVDYFENQKGFNLPTIKSYDQLNAIVQTKLKYIDDEFSQDFPLVIIASDVLSQKHIALELISKNLSVSTVQDSINIDVLVLIVDEVAGREFPVVISMITNTMADSTIYIILSRAKFDLTLVVSSNFHINSHLNTLHRLGMIGFI